MISVAAALDRLFTLAAPVAVEGVPLSGALGRVLMADVVAGRDQPPFAASAMDGYALDAGGQSPGAVLTVVGESAAGRRFDGPVGPGQAVRIFTGAPVPPGATHVALQENVTRAGDRITLGPDALLGGANIRPAGGDFAAGARLTAPRILRPTDIALAAAMGAGRLSVSRRVEVALIATGDELVPPGEDIGQDQIYTSNSYGLQAMVQGAGAVARLLPIARDDIGSLNFAFDLARGADLVVTIGGASVGDHDLVARVAQGRGADLAFHKVAMRPGKPLMAGRMGDQVMVGLPGNPVSAMVCGQVFLLPLIRALQGLPPGPAPRAQARLAAALPPNGPREHYLRAAHGPDGLLPFDRQDSSLLTLLAAADALIVQAPGHPGAAIGDLVPYIPL
jgi:molybdopterin molybdotransferase